jgi:hypothetical protein
MKKNTPQPGDPRIERLRQIYSRWDQYPGAAPGGTGATGLLSNDAAGWSKILNEQTEAQNLQNELEEKAPVTVKAGGLVGESNIPDSIADMPSWWLQGSAQGGPLAGLSSIPQSVVAARPKESLGALDALRKLRSGF